MPQIIQFQSARGEPHQIPTVWIRAPHHNDVDSFARMKSRFFQWPKYSIVVPGF